MAPVKATTRLRTLLAGPHALVAPFVFDGLQARLAEAAGFDAVYMTGFGTAASHGLPDVGLLGLAEMAQNVRVIARTVDVPVVCDADTGYGNALNVRRTVREYEDAGAAALHLEDQVWPKRCGFLRGKAVVPLEEMLPKVQAACEARRDPDFVVIARTDAYAPLGWDEAVRRARAYREAGADLVFVDGIRTREDLLRYARDLADVPRVYNGALVDRHEATHLGFRLVLHIGTLLAAYARLRDAYEELARDGRIADAPGLETLEEFARLLGLEETEPSST
jgi:2-methylisocitrate lyase-like PEP mutase family enzyme